MSMQAVKRKEREAVGGKDMIDDHRIIADDRISSLLFSVMRILMRILVCLKILHSLHIMKMRI